MDQVFNKEKKKEVTETIFSVENEICEDLFQNDVRAVEASLKLSNVWNPLLQILAQVSRDNPLVSRGIQRPVSAAIG